MPQNIFAEIPVFKPANVREKRQTILVNHSRASAPIRIICRDVASTLLSESQKCRSIFFDTGCFTVLWPAYKKRLFHFLHLRLSDVLLAVTSTDIGSPAPCSSLYCTDCFTISISPAVVLPPPTNFAISITDCGSREENETVGSPYDGLRPPPGLRVSFGFAGLRLRGAGRPVLTTPVLRNGASLESCPVASGFKARFSVRVRSHPQYVFK